MVETEEALIASGLTSGAIAGTFLLVEPYMQTGGIAISVFSASFALSYLGMKGYLPF